MLTKVRYNYRIYPNKTQREYLAKQFGCSRFVWNKSLDLMKEHHTSTNKLLTYGELSEKLTHELKAEYTWLYEVAAQPLQQSITDLHRAFCHWAKGIQRYPRFKKRSSRQSSRWPQRVKVIDEGRLSLTNVPGTLKVKWDRALPGPFTMVTIIKESSDKYYASFITTLELPSETPMAYEDTFLGVDLGIKELLVCSNGIRVENPKFFHRAEENVVRKSKALSAKKKKGSRAWRRVRRTLSRAQEKIRNQRKDYARQIASRLVKLPGYVGIAMESLQVKEAIEKSKHWAKHLQDVGWRLLRDAIQWACHKTGKKFVSVDTYFPSTQVCSTCQTTNGKIAVNVRKWTCKSCGTVHDRDINAGHNLAHYAWHISMGLGIPAYSM